MGIINIDDFFNFENHEAVNRIAYTEEDAKYKLKCIKAMQDLGMQIYIDDVGNICGTFPANFSQNKSLVMGSHTDSVTNGGQFDGPVGVYMALNAAENFKSTSSKQYGNLKTVIYACEESTRFSSACLGSYYLSGDLSFEQLSNLKDKNGISFADAVSEYKGYIFSHLSEYGIDLNNIELVDKVLSEKEISEAIESHIEQSQILSDSDNSIGIVDSIGKPLRGTIYINGKDSIVTSARIISALNNLAVSSKGDNSEEMLRITIPQFDSISGASKQTLVRSENNNLVKITSIGASDHSGATPMDRRKDAVLGLSELILKLDKLKQENPNLYFEFLGTSTEKWGANQIQDNANLVLRVEPQAALGIVKAFAEDVQEKTNVSFEISDPEWAIIEQSPFSELFVDIRQQTPATSEVTKNTVFEMLKDIQRNNPSKKDSIHFRITSSGNPMQTSNELLEDLKSICDIKKYPCQIMHSWPGHDLACVLPSSNKTGKRILFFIPSEGGSHNPQERTTREAITIGSDVYNTLIMQRMNKFKNDFEQDFEK